MLVESEAAKTHDTARQKAADDGDDKHEHSEGGETITSDNDDLIKSKAEEREEMFSFGLEAVAVNKGMRLIFVIFLFYFKIIKN